MSALKFGKKLHPAKKAWKIVSGKMKTRIRKLDFPQLVKRVILRIASTVETFGFLVVRKCRSLNRPHRSSHPHLHVRRKSFPAVHIDQLFADSVTGRHVWKHAAAEAKPTCVEIRGGEAAAMEEKQTAAAENSMADSMEAAWNVVLASSPHLRIDERAEEFIVKFRQDMKMQKEKSLIEFQERLARSS